MRELSSLPIGTPDGATVSAADFARQFGQWCQTNHDDPLFITHYGKPTHVMLTVDAFTKLASSQDSAVPADGLQELAGWISQGLIVCDETGRITLANRVMHTMCRRAEGSLLGAKIFDAMPELRGSLHEGHIQRTTLTGECCSADLPSLFRKGAWVRFEVYPFAGGFALLVRDITRDVEQYHLADAKKAIVEAMGLHGGIGYARVSPRGRIERIDAPMCKFVGLAESRLINVTLADLIVPAHRIAFRDQLDRVLRGDGAVRIETELLANDGTTVPVTGAITELRGTYGAEGAVVVVTSTK